MRRGATILLAAISTILLGGCQPVHVFQGYRGRVLELGTDRPIPNAGVVVEYQRTVVSVSTGSGFFAYQATLTDEEGRFSIPPKFAVNLLFWPSWFSKLTYVSIYKEGYGTFPGSFGDTHPKRGVTDPPGIDFWVPAGTDIIYWLPKAESGIDQRDWDRSGHRFWLRSEEGFPPPGLPRELFTDH